MKPYSSLGRTLNTAGVLGSGGMSASQPSGSSFDPASVSWTARWADQRTTSGADVTQWTDLTGNGRHYTAASNFPQVGATMNSQPTISFNGALQKFVSAVQLSAVVGSGNLTWFCAFKPAAVLLCDLMSDASSWSFFRHDTNAKGVLWDSAYRTATSTATISAGTGYVAEVRAEGGNLYCRVNGLDANEGSVAFTGLGGSGTIQAGSAFNGLICEMACINSALSATVRNNYVAYLRARYGI